MNCERCGEHIVENESFNHCGKILCEDCYIGGLQPPKTCDIAAVYLDDTVYRLGWWER